MRRLPDAAALPLFAASQARELEPESDTNLPTMSLGEHIVSDYRTIRLSLKGHPMQILRPVFAAENVACCAEIAAAGDGETVRAGGVVLVRQRPGKGNAIFIMIEDETGIANIVLWARLFERYRAAIMGARLLLVEGRVQKSPEGIVHVMAERLIDRTEELRRLCDISPPISPSPTNEFVWPQWPRGHHTRNIRILPRSRDFH